MNWLRRLMYGRYGFDALSNIILIAGVVIYFISRCSDGTGCSLFRFFVWFIRIFAVFSKNIQKRYAENEKFKAFFRPAAAFFRIRKRMWKDRKSHKYYKCPKCRQYLRAPKGKGKIKLTCPKCRQEFIVKT